MNYFFATLRNHWISIVLVTSIAVVASIAITAVQPFEYRSGFSLLVIQKTDSGDAFAAAKSAERISMSLAQVIYTSSFYDQVRASGLVDPSAFPADESTRRTEWQHAIETRSYPDVGILKISAYDVKKDKAESLALAVATVLSKNGTDYLGTGKDITLKVVDSPLTSNTPVRPSIPMNLALGFLIGLGGAVGLHLVRDARAYATQTAPREYAEPQTATVQQAWPQQVPEQRAWQPPMPVMTTVFTPQAAQRIHGQPTMPQTPQPPDAWEMPDIRRHNGW